MRFVNPIVVERSGNREQLPMADARHDDVELLEDDVGVLVVPGPESRIRIGHAVAIRVPHNLCICEYDEG